MPSEGGDKRLARDRGPEKGGFCSGSEVNRNTELLCEVVKFLYILRLRFKLAFVDLLDVGASRCTSWNKQTINNKEVVVKCLQNMHE